MTKKVCTFVMCLHGLSFKHAPHPAIRLRSHAISLHQAFANEK